MFSFNSYNDAITAAGTSTLVAFVLPNICSYVKNTKGVDLSVDELLNMLKITPVPSPNLALGINTPIINTVPPASSGRKTKAAAAKTEAAPAPAPVIDGEGCIYQYKRKSEKDGKEKGDRCNLATFNGTAYCKACYAKPGGGNKGQPAGVKATKGAKTPVGLTQAILPPSLAAEQTKTVQAKPNIVPGFLVAEGLGFVFENDDLEVFGKFVNDNMVQLQSTDIPVILEIGLKECKDGNKLSTSFNRAISNLAAQKAGTYNAGVSQSATLAMPPMATFNTIPVSNGLPLGMPSMPTMPTFNLGGSILSAGGVALPPSLNTFTPMPNYGMPAQ